MSVKSFSDFLYFITQNYFAFHWYCVFSLTVKVTCAWC